MGYYECPNGNIKGRSRNMSTRITYLIRVNDTAYVESSPAEIREFMSQGLTLDIRIVEGSK